MTPSDLTFFLLMMVVTVDTLGVNFSVPLLVPYGEELGANLQVIALGGTLRFLMNTVSMVWMPIAGDKLSRKCVVMASLIGSGTAYFMQGAASFAGKVTMWIGGRMVAGMFGGTIPVIQAMIIDISLPDTQLMKKRTVTLNIAQQALGFMLAPIAGAIASLDLALPYYVCSIAAGFTLVCVVMFLRDTKKAASERRASADTKKTDGDDKTELNKTAEEAPVEEVKEKSPWGDKALLSFGIAFFWVMMYFMGYILLIPKILEKESFGLRSKDSEETAKKVATAMGLVTLPQGLFSVASSTVLYVPLSTRLGDVPTICIGCGLTILASFGFATLPKKVWHVAVLQSFLGTGFGLLTPAIAPTVAKHASAHYQKQSAQANSIPMFGAMAAGLFGQLFMATVYDISGMGAAWGMGISCVVLFLVFYLTGYRIMTKMAPEGGAFTSNQSDAALKLGSVDSDKFVEALVEEVKHALMESQSNFWNSSITSVVNKNVIEACKPQIRPWDEKTGGAEYLADLHVLLQDSPDELAKFRKNYPHVSFAGGEAAALFQSAHTTMSV